MSHTEHLEMGHTEHHNGQDRVRSALRRPESGSHRRRTTRVLVGAAVATAVLAVGVTTASASRPAPSPSTARFEIDFLQHMIDHHHMAVMMSEVCLEKAVHEELRVLCRQITEDQNREIELMQSWLADWYGVTYEPHMNHEQMMRMLERMRAMSAEEFEEDFLKDMIRHHHMALGPSERCMRRAYHEELVDLCGNIISQQSAEIELMRSWLCEWYGRCHYGPKPHARRHHVGGHEILLVGGHESPH